MITFYSFLWGLINCNFLIIITYILSRKTSLLIQLGTSSIIFLTISCIIRIVFPLELSDNLHIINSHTIYSKIMYPYVKLQDNKIFFIIFLVLIWVIISLTMLLKFIRQTRKLHSLLKNHSLSDRKTDQEILSKIDISGKLKIQRTAFIEIPVIAGLFHPVVYLPDMDYTEEQLYYILLHEYTHWKKKDLWKKLFINVLCVIFCWNPFIWLLRKSFSQSLEIQCDKHLSKDMSEEMKMDYLETLLFSLKNVHKEKIENHLTVMEFANNKHFSESKQRFQFLLHTNKSKRTKMLCKTIFLFIFGIYWVASYHFILQPAYEVPAEDPSITEDNSILSDGSNAYLVKQEDGSYLFYFSGDPISVPAKDVEDGLYHIYPIKESE